MARKSRSRQLATATLAVVAVAAIQLSAHRRDEYLQAARIGIEPARIQLELDLTPGIAVAQAVLSQIDRNRDGVLDADEGRAYTARVLADLRLEVDGHHVELNLLNVGMPNTDAVYKGEGSIRLQLGAAVPFVTTGAHRLRFTNSHRTDIGVYLANALAPLTERITIASQRRDIDQRELTIDYSIRGNSTAASTWFPPATVALLLMSLGMSVRERTRNHEPAIRDR